MANHSVNHLLTLLNQQIDYQEDLNDCLCKAEALARIALCNDFLECSDEIKRNFLWVLNDIVENAKMINEQTLSFLFEGKIASTEIT